MQASALRCNGAQHATLVDHRQARHAFPIPYVDFWYTARRLVPGGVLMVDDTPLRACHVLAEFLESETPRWRVHTKLQTTSVFERLDSPLLPDVGWEGQPWGATPLFVPHRDPLVTRLRARMRLRTRLRTTWRRVRGSSSDGRA